MPRQTAQERIKRLTEGAGTHTLLNPEEPERRVYILWEGPQDTPFTRVIRNAPGKRTPASLRSLAAAFLCRPERTAGEARLENTLGDAGA